MSTVQIPFLYWFPHLGFRPAVLEDRESFAGKSGMNTHILVSRDANEIFQGKSKFESVLEEEFPLFGATHQPKVFAHQPKVLAHQPPPLFRDPPFHFCCMTHVPPHTPPKQPYVIPLDDSLVFILIGLASLVAIGKMSLFRTRVAG